MQNDAGITVLIPTPLRRFTGGEAKVFVTGSSVAESLTHSRPPILGLASDSRTIQVSSPICECLCQRPKRPRP